MALSQHEMHLLLDACKKPGPSPNYRCNDYVENVMNMALDFQMDSNVVTASIDYFNGTHGAKSHRRLR